MPGGKPVVDAQAQRRDPARVAAVDAERHVDEQPAARGDRGPDGSREQAFPDATRSALARQPAGWARRRPAAGKLWPWPTPPAPSCPCPRSKRVRPGLWSIPVPIPNNPLRYVLVYAFETDRGPYLIDAGWNTDDAYQTLVAGLEQAGFAIDRRRRACWSPTSIPTTTGWPGGSGRRPGRGLASTRPTPA